MRRVLPAVLVFALSSTAVAQDPGRGQDTTINAAMRARVIDGVLSRLDQGYVFPKKVAAMRHALRTRAKQGAYDRIGSAQALADTLIRDLQAISRDKHLEVAYRSGGIVDEPPDAEPPAEEQQARTEFARRVNSASPVRRSTLPKKSPRTPGRCAYAGWPSARVSQPL